MPRVRGGLSAPCRMDIGADLVNRYLVETGQEKAEVTIPLLCDYFGKKPYSDEHTALRYFLQRSAGKRSFYNFSGGLRVRRISRGIGGQHVRYKVSFIVKNTPHRPVR